MFWSIDTANPLRFMIAETREGTPGGSAGSCENIWCRRVLYIPSVVLPVPAPRALKKKEATTHCLKSSDARWKAIAIKVDFPDPGLPLSQRNRRCELRKPVRQFLYSSVSNSHRP